MSEKYKQLNPFERKHSKEYESLKPFKKPEVKIEPVKLEPIKVIYWLIKFFVDGEMVFEDKVENGKIITYPQIYEKDLPGKKFIRWSSEAKYAYQNLVINAVFEPIYESTPEAKFIVGKRSVIIETLPNKDKASVEKPAEIVKEVEVVKPVETTKLNEIVNNDSSNLYGKYVKPTYDLLYSSTETEEKDFEFANMIKENIEYFFQNDHNINAYIFDYIIGPVFTLFRVVWPHKIPLIRLEGLQDNLRMVTRSSSLRVLAPIPDQEYAGIEIPNKKRSMVYFSELLTNEKYVKNSKVTLIPLGKNTHGELKYTEISNFPHGIVAGSNKSGKSVFLQSSIASLLYRTSPDDVRIILVDPKQTDFVFFEDIPHLYAPIVTLPSEAAYLLEKIHQEVKRRQLLYKKYYCQNLPEYNEYAVAHGLNKLYYILIFVEEAASLLGNGTVQSKDFEDHMTDLATYSRSAGVHIIISAQRPDAKLVKGQIRNNFIARVCFQVSDGDQSGIIIGVPDAKHLLGAGDMIYSTLPDNAGLGRVQAPYISSEELKKISNFVRTNNKPVKYIIDADEIARETKKTNSINPFTPIKGSEDERFMEVVRWIYNTGYTSINSIKVNCRIGNNIATAIIEELESYGILSKRALGKNGDLLVNSLEEIYEILEENGIDTSS